MLRTPQHMEAIPSMAKLRLLIPRSRSSVTLVTKQSGKVRAEGAYTENKETKFVVFSENCLNLVIFYYRT